MERKPGQGTSGTLGTLALRRRRDTVAGWTLNSLNRPLAQGLAF
jgi:hypothetical protein